MSTKILKSACEILLAAATTPKHDDDIKCDKTKEIAVLYNKEFLDSSHFVEIDTSSRATKTIRSAVYDRVLTDLTPDHKLWSIEHELLKNPILFLKDKVSKDPIYYREAPNGPDSHNKADKVAEKLTESDIAPSPTVKATNDKIDKRLTTATDAINKIGEVSSEHPKSF